MSMATRFVTTLVAVFVAGCYSDGGDECSGAESRLAIVGLDSVALLEKVQTTDDLENFEYIFQPKAVSLDDLSAMAAHLRKSFDATCTDI